jgi:hypothetical protein
MTIERKRIPIVRITVKPDFYFYNDVLMHEFDNTSIPEAKADAVKQIIAGLPKNKFHVKHTKEIVWIYEDEYDAS